MCYHFLDNEMNKNVQQHNLNHNYKNRFVYLINLHEISLIKKPMPHIRMPYNYYQSFFHIPKMLVNDALNRLPLDAYHHEASINDDEHFQLILVQEHDNNKQRDQENFVQIFLDNDSNFFPT